MNVYQSNTNMRLPDGTDLKSNKEFMHEPTEHILQLVESKMIFFVSTVGADESFVATLGENATEAEILASMDAEKIHATKKEAKKLLEAK
jgi:hypothetical protein